VSALGGVAVVLLVGGGIHAWARRATAGLPWSVGVPLWGALGCTAWLGGAALVGVRWSAALVVAMAAAAAVAGAAGLGGPAPARPRLAAAGAAAVAAAHATILAASPASGWDFRYIWGLKARVIAAAGGFDWAWLAWPGHAFAHPDYPPAWPALLAVAALLRGDVAVAAALWQAALALALAAACWWAARSAPLAPRLLAAAVGAWSPVVFAPVHSGYAEPLLAFAAVVALASLRDLAIGEEGAAVPLAAGVALLALTKNEGIALAVGAAAGAALVAGRRAAPALAALAPAALWKAVVALHGIPGQSLDLTPATLGLRALQLPGALVRWASAPAMGVLAVALALAVAGMSRRIGSPGVLAALAVWLGATVAMYVGGTNDVSWWFATSLERVLAAPLPAVAALALSGTGGGGAKAGAPARP